MSFALFVSKVDFIVSGGAEDDKDGPDKRDKVPMLKSLSLPMKVSSRIELISSSRGLLAFSPCRTLPTQHCMLSLSEI